MEQRTQMPKHHQHLGYEEDSPKLDTLPDTIPTPPVTGIRVEPDELVYVEGIVKDRPMAHKIVERRIGKDTWNYTLCGLKMCFSMKNVIMPAKHAIKIARGCPNCKE